ncbi:hypothetical protein [Helicobacter turcicus]|uniref:DNA helicase n=1 Tax=Helicobacter turcicus TaxID=2867412 RepID=A0ABS7JNA1_9HELI|nr:hypothetical protein [Helicobacter turcicus]MBX7490853.1 hypothetical protein [Helicobacter turcicus]MBX7545707.1 hypothetical protein [Helicobacter turcicus]
MIHFHGFAKALLEENIPHKGADGITRGIIELETNAKNREYDAILIDDAQDIEKMV